VVLVKVNFYFSKSMLLPKIRKNREFSHITVPDEYKEGLDVDLNEEYFKYDCCGGDPGPKGCEEKDSHESEEYVDESVGPHPRFLVDCIISMMAIFVVLFLSFF
jgi:hypothetical protein